MTNHPLEAPASRPDPAAVWAAFAAPPGRPVPVAAPARTLPPASTGVAVLLLLAGLVLTIFAPICWIYCNGQLREIGEGVRSPEGRTAIEVVRGLSVFVTMLAVTLIFVLVAHSVR